MFATSLIAISFSLGFFIESIVGFGGALIAYSILAFFLDVKSMILGALYIGTLASMKIIYTDFKSFDKKIFFSSLPICLIGLVLGTFLFVKLPAEILSLILGGLLFLLAIKILFFDRFIFPKIFKSKLILIGGIAHGAFGTGGPFLANALQKDFQNKSNLRTTLAAFFVFFNLIRFVQLTLQKQIEVEFFINIWWAIIPILFAIRLGHKIHLKISEDLFKKAIALMTVIAALKLISNAFFN
jgi:uncharacterized membrane protein YfcA